MKFSYIALSKIKYLNYYYNNFDSEYVRLGDHDLTSKKDGTFQQIKVKTIIRHERFTLTTLANDIAILTLERDVTFSGKLECMKSWNMNETKYFVTIF